MRIADMLTLVQVLQAERDYISGLIRDPSLNPHYVPKLTNLVEPLTTKINHITNLVYTQLPPQP